jgi:dTDP-4-dehydrorhamnose 3,5-epimerase
MMFTPVAISGAYVVEAEPRADERGFFARQWCAEEFARAGLSAAFVQCNGSFSARKGTLRGMHYQVPPDEEIKLVRCIRGAVFDVMIDLRPASATHKQWFGIELTADNRKMLYVPAGCAHGYLTMCDHSEVLYPVTQYYRPDAERGVRWNDPAFGVQWPAMAPLTISAKDAAWPDYRP